MTSGRRTGGPPGAAENTFRPTMDPRERHCVRQGAAYEEGTFPLRNEPSAARIASLLGPSRSRSCFFQPPVGPPPGSPAAGNFRARVIPGRALLNLKKNAKVLELGPPPAPLDSNMPPPTAGGFPGSGNPRSHAPLYYVCANGTIGLPWASSGKNREKVESRGGMAPE